MRFVYNKLLGAQNDRYADGLKNLSRFDASKYCTHSLKPEYEFLKEVDSFALTNAAFHLDDAFKRFFEKKATLRNTRLNVRLRNRILQTL